MQSSFDNENIGNKLAEIIDLIHNDANPVLLRKYRKTFKREVSLLKRSWAAAWLLMYYDKNSTSCPPRQDRRAEHDFLAGEETVRLFFSIGRNRRVFQKEILSLITGKASVSSEDIGAIRILDNYSFVQVRESQAQHIIDSLNGQKIRGRPLVVNFAKSKNSDDQSEGNAPKQEQDGSDKKEIEADPC